MEEHIIDKTIQEEWDSRMVEDMDEDNARTNLERRVSIGLNLKS